MSVAPREQLDEHELYPVHEEDTVPERPQHEAQVRYLREALGTRLPQYWVTGDVCMYWEELAFALYRAPDVLVVDRPRPAELPPVYLKWSDSAALMVVEVGSKSTFREDEGPKVERYLLDLGVAEYLYFWPHRNPKRRRLRMWRLIDDEAMDVAPLPGGRYFSETLGLEFGLDETGFLRVYERDGTPLPTSVELSALARQERERAEHERQRAEHERERAEQERQRAEQERERAAALEQELDRLRKQLRQANVPEQQG